jgi:HD-like signal output (HDOD) protein
MASAVSTLLDEINNLPTAPKVFHDLMDEFDKTEADVDRVTSLIGADPVLAVKMLRMANSSYYARKGTVDRLQDAIVYVGLHATRNLVMAVGLAGSIGFPKEFPRASFWRYSLHSAVAARYVAGKARQNAGTAFALGLMRAIGEPLTASVMTTSLKKVDAVCPFFDSLRAGEERRRLGFSYVEVSTALAERWHFPRPMIAALRSSEAPEPASEEGRMGAAVWVGAWIAGEHEAQRGVNRGVPEMITERLRFAGIYDDVLREMPPLATLAQGLEALVN